MAEEGPYATPASPPPPIPAYGPAEPSAVKAFGIMHLVLAAFGLLMGAWSMVSLLIGPAMIPAGSPGYAAQIRYQDQLKWVTVMTGTFMLALAALLFVSGLKLVRSRADGVKWSHRYSWTSIVTKLISLVVTVAWVLPATQRMLDEIIPHGTGGKAEAGMTTAMKGLTAIGSVASPLLGCIYPALALFFLSRPAVKAWCAARP